MTTFRNINIQAYRPGRSLLKKNKSAIKLSANESALGVSPRVLRVLRKKNLKIFKYPDSKSIELRKMISKKFNCNINKIICD